LKIGAVVRDLKYFTKQKVTLTACPCAEPLRIYSICFKELINGNAADLLNPGHNTQSTECRDQSQPIIFDYPHLKKIA
jgi:hypothetical protein